MYSKFCRSPQLCSSSSHHAIMSSRRTSTGDGGDRRPAATLSPTTVPAFGTLSRGFPIHSSTPPPGGLRLPVLPHWHRASRARHKLNLANAPPPSAPPVTMRTSWTECNWRVCGDQQKRIDSDEGTAQPPRLRSNVQPSRKRLALSWLSTVPEEQSW